MAPRLQLQQLLSSISGVKKVYFQPPESIRLEFPCIIYKENPGMKRNASNEEYKYDKQYEVVFITNDPDSTVPDVIRKLRYCSFTQKFTSDNLHHFVYRLYY